MSNVITRTYKKNVKKQKDKDLFNMYYSLMGSIILSTGIIEGRTEDESLELFKKLRKSNFKAESVVDAVKKIQTKDDTIDNLALIYDDKNILSPMVAVYVDETVLPLYRNGFYHGILNHIGKPNIIVESLVESLEGENGEDAE